jgi:hypothetical protein
MVISAVGKYLPINEKKLRPTDRVGPPGVDELKTAKTR